MSHEEGHIDFNWDELNKRLEQMGEDGRIIFTEDSQPSWASEDPLRFYQLRDVIRNQAGLDIDAAQAARVLNAYGTTFFEENGRFPRYDEITRDERFWTSYGRSAFRSDLLPPFFGVQGPAGFQWYQNNGQTILPVAAPPGAESPDRLNPDGFLIDGLLDRANPYPIYSQAEFESVINFDAAGPRGGGSGGGGRGARVFDRAQVEEAVTQIWRRRMLEPPPGGLPDKFISQAQAFWRTGGNLDLEAFVMGEMRKTGRYQTLYSRKDPSMNEDEWLGQYLNVASQTGLRADIVSRETIRGASSGAAPTAFANSLTESADVQAMGTGGLSRRFAQMISRIPS